ncbi:MAG: hypothetical protein HBSAPP03_03930 [Phycisphaerae bacterium]|nr:MAG: hypothetical protein HBSAPP03_03930 [Phycisphaerae bacterium]
MMQHGARLGIFVMGAAGVTCAEPPKTPEPNHATPRLVCERTGLEPGKVATLALTFDIAAKWHLYWNGLIEEGMTPAWSLTMPEGFEAEPAQWPVPQRLVLPGDVLSHVYEGTLTVLIPVRVPESARAGQSVTIQGTVSWVACSSVCIPENEAVSATFRVVAPGEATATPEAKRIEAARLNLPRPIDQAEPKVSVEAEDGRLTVRAPGATRVAFFPGVGCVEVPRIVAQGDRRGERLIIDLEHAENARVVGMVRVEREGVSPKGYWIDVPVKKRQAKP